MTDDELSGSAGSHSASLKILRGFALPYARDLQPGITELRDCLSFRHAVTPGGFTMSSEPTRCFTLGWTTIERSQERRDADGPWPALPSLFKHLARDAAVLAGFENFDADACLIDRSPPGARLSFHQERSVPDACAPIVALTLGMASAFLFRGREAAGRSASVTLWHGDVVVWTPASVNSRQAR
jgi:alkylated DNA repair protein (DNA oxidative demethylase)